MRKSLLTLVLLLASFASYAQTRNCMQVNWMNLAFNYYYSGCLGPFTDNRMVIWNMTTQAPDTTHAGTAGMAVLNSDSTASAMSALGAMPMPSGSASQYVAGDGSLITFPVNVSGFTNDSSYITQSDARNAITITNTGSGAATYNNTTGNLNVPVGSAGTITSVVAGTGLSGGTITTTGTISLPNTGTAGTYSGVTTDAQGRVTAGTTASVNDAPGRTLVGTTSSTGFQVSSSRNAQVCYEGTFSLTSTIGGPAAISVFLETAATNSTTPSDWATIAQQSSSNTITLAVILNQVATGPWAFCRNVSAGKFVRIRSGAATGTASATINTNQQETTL